MKKWTGKDVTRLVLRAEALPAPFPGRTPTRMYWVVKFSDGTIQSYFGKPSQSSYQRFNKLTSRSNLIWYTCKEVDRGSVIAEITDSYRPESLIFSRRNTRLSTYYKPETVWRQIPGTARFYSHRTQGHWIYLPSEVLTPASANAYANWLRVEGFNVTVPRF